MEILLWCELFLRDWGMRQCIFHRLLWYSVKDMKLIILYGFASSGKSTLAKRYIDDNPMTIAIEGDELINMIGGWRKNESDARHLVFEYTKSIAEIHLGNNHDVFIPYFLSEASGRYPKIGTPFLKFVNNTRVAW